METTLNTAPDLSSKNYAVLYSYSFWKKFLFLIREQTFTYPVVYTDGLISCRVADSKTHQAWGILINNFILYLHEPPIDSFEHIQNSYQNMVFAGQNISIINAETLNKIKNNYRNLNQQIRQLNGDEINGDWYRSSDAREINGQLCHKGLHINSTKNKVYIVPADTPIRTRIGIFLSTK